MKQEIIKRYKNRNSIVSIMKELNVSYKKVRRILEEEKVYMPFNSLIYDDSIVSYIKEHYYTKKANEICENLKISDDVLYRVLKYYKIPLRGSGTLIDNPTKNIRFLSKEFYYLFGWIVSDGHVSEGKSKNYLVSISTKDKEIVSLIQKYFPFFKNHVKKNSEQNHLYINNKEFYSFFKERGFVSKKAQSIFIEKMPINNHIIRGIFDGDGSVRDLSKRHSYDAKITTGSIKLVEQIKETLEKESIITKVYPNGKCYNLTIQGKENLYKFYNYLYKDCDDLFLTRKRKLFVAMYGDIH